MELEFSREEMHYLLKGKHISLFGKGELSQKQSEKVRKKLSKEGLLDQSGIPVPELAGVVETILYADDELSCPFPFEDVSDIRLRSTLFIKEGKVLAARKEGSIRLQFVLETLGDARQVEQAIQDYLGVQANKRHTEPFSLILTANEAELLGEASMSGDIQTMRTAARKYDVPIETLIYFFQEVLVDIQAEAVTLIAARCNDSNPGTLILKIRPELGLVFRWIMAVPGLEDKSLVSLEEIPEGNLLRYLVDYRGY